MVVVYGLWVSWLASQPPKDAMQLQIGKLIRIIAHGRPCFCLRRLLSYIFGNSNLEY